MIFSTVRGEVKPNKAFVLLTLAIQQEFGYGRIIAEKRFLLIDIFFGFNEAFDPVFGILH
jgi:hypothetical protein